MRNMKILIIDDEQDWLTCFVETIKSIEESAQILSTTDPKIALKLVTEHCFDLIFIDLNMPIINGEFLILEVKSISPNSQVVIVSANTKINCAVKCIRLGADDYIDKGDDYDQFMKQLELCLLSTNTNQSNQS
ncbi:response regulator, partial [Shewanella sp. 10N.286.52.B9]|uniref:response regulator n=1 Tax=Shewanella sp. 10N.286.52.B9 TaxID=1880837 RepID=UPI001054F3DA